MPDPIRLLIVGTGSMARLHAENFRAMPDVELVGGVDLDAERLAGFCEHHGIPRQFASLDEALLWGQFDAASNVTPDRVHYPTTMKLLAAGRHVFCEKPLATTHAHASAMAAAAENAGVVAMVNLTYRNVPALQRARELVLAGELGAVRHVEASYLQSWLTSNYWGDWRTTPAWLWRLSRGHGSNGVLGDVGIHVLDLASYGAASEIEDMTCRLKTFHKADGDRIGEYLLDANDSFVMSVEFDNGALGVIHATRMATGYKDDVRLRVFGELGAIEMSFGYEAPLAERVSRLRACLGEDRHTQTWTEIALEPVETNYQRFIRAIREGQTLEPSFAHAANLQRLLDRALAAERSDPGETFVASA
jgi:predicted dehydrogenase